MKKMTIGVIVAAVVAVVFGIVVQASGYKVTLTGGKHAGQCVSFESYWDAHYDHGEGYVDGCVD